MLVPILKGHVYTLRCEAHSAGRFLDMASGNSNDGAQVVGFHPETLLDNALNQLWILHLVGGTTDVYTIQNVRTGTFLEVSGCDRRDGTAIVASAGHDRKNQQWKVYECEWIGRYRLQNIASGTFLDLPKSEDYARVHAWSQINNNPNQMWTLVRASRSAEEVRNALESPYVDVENFKSYRADAIYINIPKNLRQEIWTASGLKDAVWRESIFDCDNFAFVAKAAVANYARSNIRANNISLLFGIAYASNNQDVHAYNFYLNDSLDKIVWFEPQNGKEMTYPAYRSHFGTY